MRFSLRLILVGTVAACAPMLPEPPPVQSPFTPPPEPSAPADIVEFLGMTTSAECNVGGGPHSGFPKLVR